MLPAPVSVRSEHFALGATLGQCCGGAVELRFERYGQEDREALRKRLREEPRPMATPLWLFGAGHVGRALVSMLGELPFQVTWVDGRENIFPISLPANVQAADTDVAAAPAGAFFLVMTHSHDLDHEIVRAILKRGDFAWLGLIGSETKARRFRQKLAAQGLPRDRIERIACPIGIDGIESKLPGAVAVSVAAQLQQELERRNKLSEGTAQRGTGG